MSKLLTEQELEEKIYSITQSMFVTLSEWQAGEVIDWNSAKARGRTELKELIQSQKLAHGEMVIGEDMKEYHPNAPFERNGVKMSPRGENQRIRNENSLRSEQRLRNQV